MFGNIEGRSSASREVARNLQALQKFALRFQGQGLVRAVIRHRAVGWRWRLIIHALVSHLLHGQISMFALRVTASAQQKEYQDPGELRTPLAGHDHSFGGFLSV